ncbi:MAG TPA: RluA family pseudouridine synthase [Candidatus Paceibacterota bacterium]
MELPILFENDELVAINKPIGVMTHPDGVTKEESVSDWFAARYPNSADVGETQRLKDGTEIMRPGIVHRLDRETSGVLVLAKTKEVHAFLKNAFQEREVHKTYMAFVYGVPNEEEGKIEFAIGRSRKDFRLRSAQPKAKGRMREAVTRYQILGSTGTHSLLEVMPETGRTHQIRVHLKAIHHPVVCDPLYAPKGACDLGFSRLGLHAAKIDLPTLDGERLVIEAPLPEDLASARARFS